MRKTLVIAASVAVMLVASQQAFAHIKGPGLGGIGNLRGFPPIGWGTKPSTRGIHRRDGGALGIGGFATPNVRCPRGAFCAF